jgi:hypothetical protein
MSDTTNSILYSELGNDELSFVYLGKFDNSVLGFATEILKGHLSQTVESEGKKNKLSFLMIESFQNILRYGLAGRAADITSGEVFIVRKHQGSYYITTGNYVENVNIATMREKLERVNSLSPEDLKKLFMMTLQNKKISKQGGAGLGFMEMVRKTKEKLDFDFVELDAERSFFFFQLRLKDDPVDNSPALPIAAAKKIKSLMEANGRFIALKGDFRQSAINPILSMAENNISEESLRKQRSVYHILVEMLQNIARHAVQKEDGRREGMFSMGYDDGNFIVSASNGIEDSAAARLLEYVGRLNSMTHEQLDDYYKRVLREGHDDASISSGLGLIDVARDSVDGIDCSVSGEDTVKLLSMTAKL